MGCLDSSRFPNAGVYTPIAEDSQEVLLVAVLRRVRCDALAGERHQLQIPMAHLPLQTGELSARSCDERDRRHVKAGNRSGVFDQSIPNAAFWIGLQSTLVPFRFRISEVPSSVNHSPFCEVNR